MKAFALHWPEDPPKRFGRRALTSLLALNAVIAVAFAVSSASRAQFSAYALLVLQASACGTMYFAYRLSRRYRLLNARLLAGTFAVTLVPALLLFALDVAAGKDMLAVETVVVGVWSMAAMIFLAVCNNGLFIGVVTDLAARREIATSAELQRLKEQRLRLEERARVMADLHDGLGSQLASARLSAEHDELDTARVRILLDECLSDLHLVVDTLNNRDGSLAEALRFLRHRVQARLSDRHPQVHWDLDVDRAPVLDGALILQLLRIVQEALTNALRHAAAQNIRVGASYDAGRLHLSVRDDGRGFTAEAPEGHGLRNMHRRARRNARGTDAAGARSGPGAGGQRRSMSSRCRSVGEDLLDGLRSLDAGDDPHRPMSRP